MSTEIRNMTPNANLYEQIRLLYVQVLSMFLGMHHNYKKIKAKVIDTALIKYIHLIDKGFYDDNGKFSWQNIRLLMPPNLEENIRMKYVMLNENEIRLCCLVLFDVDVNDISDILPYKRNTLYVMKTRIKHKTGMTNLKEDLRHFVMAVS